MKRLLSTLVAATICGALAGAAAGFTTSWYIPVESMPLRVTSTSTVQGSIAPTSTFALIPLERRSVTPLVPPAFAKRRLSPVASVYHKPKGTALEDRLLTDDRLLGQAIALTSDGWFVTTVDVVGALRIAEMSLWYKDKSYPVQQGVIDHLNGTIFLKTAAMDVSPTAFAHLQDLQPGAEMWLEMRAGQLAPSVVVSVTDRTSVDPVSSEIVSRRIVGVGVSDKQDRGSAAWDPNGSLIGILEGEGESRVRLIPASSIAASFSSLLTHGVVRHASLGVKTIDLADIRIDGDRGTLPSSGALVRDDKKAGGKLKVGDVILRVDRDILDGSADLGEILADYQPGTPVTIRVLRGTADTDLTVTLGQVTTSELLK